MTEEQIKRIALIKKLKERALDISSEPAERESALNRIAEIMSKYSITDADLVDAPEPATPPEQWDLGELFYSMGLTPQEVEKMFTTTLEEFLASTKWFPKKTLIAHTVAEGVVKAGKIGASRLVARFFMDTKS